MNTHLVGDVVEISETKLKGSDEIHPLRFGGESEPLGLKVEARELQFGKQLAKF
jgi:hypothetical protein